MTTSISLKEKLTSTAEVLIRERLNVLAAVLASIGASTDKQHLLLDRLVLSIRESVLVPTLTDASGAAIPVVAEYEEGNQGMPTIKFNESMLASVSEITEEMLIDCLAKPIAKILGLPVATVAIVLHERDEEQIRQLSVKLASAVEGEVINFSALRSVQAILLERFFNRIAKVCSLLTGGLDVPVIRPTDEGVSDLLDRIATFSRWPSWSAVRGNEETDLTLPYARPLNLVVQHTCKALRQTPWLGDSMKLIKSIWNCADLGQRSFLVEVGRALRSLEVNAPANVLMVVAEAVGSDTKDFSLRLQDWPRFAELQAAMERLYRTESGLFGTACETQNHKKPVSVVDISGRAFGLNEPEELPWRMPLLCWTQRETDALRDLFLGKCKTTYGTSARESCRRSYDFSWHNTGDSELLSNRLAKLPSVQLLPIGNLDTPGVADALNIGAPAAEVNSETGQIQVRQRSNDSVVERCWKAVFKVMKEHFDEIPRDNRGDLISMMRTFYDELNPEMAEAWGRRFAPIMRGNQRRAFSTLCRELADIIGKPCLIDPFEGIESGTPLERPRLVFVCAIEKDTDVCVAWIPLTLLTATKSIGPLMLRLVEEDTPQADESGSGESTAEEGARFKWLRDIPIHIDFFSEQPKDVMLQCVYGDALQIVVTK